MFSLVTFPPKMIANYPRLSKKHEDFYTIDSFILNKVTFVSPQSNSLFFLPGKGVAVNLKILKISFILRQLDKVFQPAQNII